MINKDLEHYIADKISFPLTAEQNETLRALVAFFQQTEPQTAFLLKGYAGTGKTTLVGAVIQSLIQFRHKVVLLAPTGRAAKVFSRAAGAPAYTIHRKIYRQKVFDGTIGVFGLNDNLYQNTLFFIDESSMISNISSGDQAAFGGRCLLDDLVRYVYAGKGCRMVLIGDDAQLPPVGTQESPALSKSRLESYGLKVYAATLTGVHRQMAESGILWNASALRQFLNTQGDTQLPCMKTIGLPDIVSVSGDTLIEELEQAYSKSGMDETIVITRSNKRANIYNQGIRGRILGREELLTSGDWLVVAKNNYFWMDEETRKMSGMDFIANGDMARVRKVRHHRCIYGFDFADAVLEFPDYDSLEIEATLVLNTLTSEAASLTRAESEHLFQSVWEDYPEVTNKRERLKKIKTDALYNALQVKFAYAVTCHKAQGGQWERVFIDQGYVGEDQSVDEFARWLYTAVTRARKCVYLVNWPSSQLL